MAEEFGRALDFVDDERRGIEGQEHAAVRFRLLFQKRVVKRDETVSVAEDMFQQRGLSDLSGSGEQNSLVCFRRMADDRF